MMLFLRFVFLFLGMCYPAYSDDTTPYRLVSVTPILEALELKHYELPNGLQVAIVEDATRPVVTCQINYRVGSADEPPKRQGLAHLVEHLLHDPAFLDQLNLQIGRHSNASTSRDGTRYYATTPKHLLSQVLNHFAKDMVSFDATQEAFDIEKNVVISEAVSRYNQANQMISHRIYNQVFSEHPYQYAIGGTHVDTIKAFTLAMATQFHQRYYVPQNACLVVVGDVQAATVMRAVAASFGKIPTGEAHVRNTVFTPTFTRTSKDTVVYQEDAREPTLWTVWPIPSASHPDRIPLSLLMKVLQSGGSSPLNQAFRNTHLALSSQLSISVQKDAGYVYHKAVLAPQVSQIAITFSLNKVIRSIVDSLSDSRMQVVRNYARKDLYAMITSQPSLAGVIGYSFIYTGDPTYRIKWMQALDQVSKADIQRVAKTYLMDQPMRQFVLTKIPPTSPSYFTSGKIIFIAALMVLVVLIFRYYKYRDTWQSLGVLLVVFSTTAHADIPNHKIYYQHDPRVPQTEISLIYATGGRTQEPAGKTGMLFALERLLYDHIRKNISPHFDRLGAYVQFAVSDLDATVKIRVFSENLDETLLLVHNFMDSVQFEERELHNNRRFIMSGFEKYVDNRRVTGVLMDRFFKHKEFRRIGTRQGIARVTAKDLNQYVLKTRHAKTLYFKAVSDLDEMQIEKSLQIFTNGRVQNGFSSHPKPKRNEISHRQFVVVPVVYSRVDYCYGVTNALSRHNERWFAQLLLVDALDQFLFYKLREQKGWCYSAGVSLKTQFFPPVIQFYANSPKNNTEQLAPEMYRLIRRFHEDPEFWTRLDKSKARLKQAYFMKYDLGQVLNQQIEYDRDGILPVSVEDYERAIDRVTREDIDHVIESVLNPSGFETSGLQMIFFGERERLEGILKRRMPSWKVEVFDPDRLKDEVD